MLAKPSKVDPNLWLEFEAFCREHGVSITNVIKAAKKNCTPFWLLDTGNPFQACIKRLFETVPIDELVYGMHAGNTGKWVKQTTADRIVPGRTYRLNRHWAEPEKPKELVGWEYLETILEPIVIIDYKNYRIVRTLCAVYGRAVMVYDTTGDGAFVEAEMSCRIINGISKSNSKVIFPVEE
jgi:hypothetical protein